ncbi:MAG: LamG domain-containing protein [Planctomycetota bacterium]|jgi:hypothetical protein
MIQKLLRSSLVAFLAVLSVGASALVQPSAVAADKDAPKTLDNDPHLVGWWKLDETSGRTAGDSSKNKRRGTLKEELSFDEGSVEGKIGKALKFGGEDGLVEIAKYKGIVGTKPRTVAAWIKTTSSRGQVISWGADDFGKMFTFRFHDPVHDDQWHHVAAVIKEAELPNLHDDAVLYLDGVVAEIHDIGLLDLWPIDTGSDLDVTIGAGFKGLIDDVRIYDRALSNEEVMALFKLQSDRELPKPKK